MTPAEALAAAAAPGRAERAAAYDERDDFLSMPQWLVASYAAQQLILQTARRVDADSGAPETHRW